MTLRRQLAARYSIIVALCLAVLGWLSYHEFVEEPAMFRELGIKEPASTQISELFELLIFAGVPIIFLVGWWLVRHSLRPIDELAASVERFDVNNLSQRLPRSGNGDEVDRMTAAFNGMAGRLERSVGQIREFTLGASHELKTPLTVMRAQLETALAESAPLTEAHRTALENLLEETQRLARIVDGLTLLSKADAGIVALERKPVRLDELVREAAEDAEVLAQPSGIQVRLLRCDPALISGDRHRLRQMLLNLVDNAAKYNQAKGLVELSLGVEAGWLQLVVANTGAGISAEMLPRVFDRFVRGSAGPAERAESCGLGLTIAKWIAEAHGGGIEIASEPGRLTTVTLRLPQHHPREAAV
jgi:signal transduction histidine kinase